MRKIVKAFLAIPFLVIVVFMFLLGGCGRKVEEGPKLSIQEMKAKCESFGTSLSLSFARVEPGADPVMSCVDIVLK